MYAYSSDIWPPLATAIYLVFLGFYSWQRRDVPGARPFAIACLFSVLWLIGIVAEIATVHVATKIVWIKFQSAWRLPAVTAITCFVLEYAYPGRWMTRRNLLLLSIFPILALALIVTNDVHGLLWIGFTDHGIVWPLTGVGGWGLIGYGLGLQVINIIIFTGLFIRAPQLRWLIALMVLGQILGRVVFLLDFTSRHPTLWVDPLIIAFVIPFGIYTIALFGFRIFDPLSAARKKVFEQMRDGMLVLDAHWHILDLNAAAESILGISRASVRGQSLREILPTYPDLGRRLAEMKIQQAEIRLQIGAEARYYSLDFSPIKDQRGLLIGNLLLLCDVTEQYQAQAQALAKQWTQATLQEREQLAHELHDGFSQSLAFLNLQAQAANAHLQTGEIAAARVTLTRLAEVSREMQDNVRELIGNLLVVSLPAEGFCSTLREIVSHFERQTDLVVELEIDDEANPICDPRVLSPVTGVQLLRIVQEALANVRKHAGNPDYVSVQLRSTSKQLHLTIADNGVGFDPYLTDTQGGHFGLQVIRQRAAHIGGQAAVHAAPSQGTRIEVWIPLALLAQQKQSPVLMTGSPELQLLRDPADTEIRNPT